VTPTFHITISGNVIAAYAAVVSTCTGIFQIFNYFRDRSKIKLSVRHNMQMFGSPKYHDQTLTLVYVANHGRRPVTINTVGARCLYPHPHIVLVDVQPPLPHELTEGKNLIAILPKGSLDLSTIDLWEATDAMGHRYVLKVASWRERFVSDRRLRAEWRLNRAGLPRTVSNPEPPAPKEQKMSSKTGAESNKFALGFCLGTIVTIFYSLMTWGSRPTPSRLLFSLVFMFLCCAYVVLMAANWAAKRFFKMNPRATVTLRCMGILLVAIGTTLSGRDLWPKPPLIEMRISPSGFPISIPPHSLVSILRVHPYIPLTDSNDWLLKDSNDTGKEVVWPSQTEIDSAPSEAHETVYRVEVTNHSAETLVGGKLTFQLQYGPGASIGCMPSPDNAKAEDVVLISPLDPGKSFEFFAINQSDLCAWLIPPVSAVVRMANDEAERQVPVTFDKDPLYGSGAPSFIPTKIKWEGLPQKPGPHYQIQRIAN
jgi:hypothetical protein